MESNNPMMTKQDFVALADMIRDYNAIEIFEDPSEYPLFTEGQIRSLAIFCHSQNPRFKRQQWLDYVAGTCGPNGGRSRAINK